MQLQSYKNKIEYTSLFAPVSGYVTSVLFEESEMVDAGTQVFSVMDSRHSEVEIDVPADVFLNRDKITSISATSSFHPDSYPLHIVTTNPKADANQLYHLRLAFTSTPPSNLTAGLNVSVSVEMSSASPSGYSLPVHSLVARPDGSRFVWTVSPDSSVVARDVVVSSVTSDGLALISSGVSPADKVVKAGGSHLHPDDKVVIISSSK
ncbi:MAG: efflux RND transporter periplasmic adaptor subunit [Bacteroidales bacterium]|nr:efflux RND transporter periplasmic adaptor subunit [Bacteroidales bacterium]